MQKDLYEFIIKALTDYKMNIVVHSLSKNECMLGISAQHLSEVPRSVTNKFSSMTENQALNPTPIDALKNEIDIPLSIHSNVENNGIDFSTQKLDNTMLLAKVVLNDYGSKILAKHGKNIKSGTILGEATEATLKPAKNNAFENARQFLVKKGVTPEWRDEVKRKKTSSQIEGLDLALAKARNENSKIIEVSVRSAKTLKKDQFYQVYGIDKNDKKYILDVFVSDDKARNNYQLAVDNYLEKN